MTSPGRRLLAVGCVRQEKADTGFVVLGVPGGSTLMLDCSGVERTKWRRAYRLEVQDRAERLAVEGLTAAMTGYWQYQVVEITSTCTSWLGAVEYLLPSDANVAVYTPDGQYVGHYDFVGGVPLRFDFYSSFPCTELVLSQGEWVEFQDPTNGEGSGGGSGGDGGGDGDDGPPPPPPSPPYAVDYLQMDPSELVVPGDTINCRNPSVPGAIAYCSGIRLSSMPSRWVNRLLEANERMRQKGGLCATKSAIVDSLIARDAISTSWDAGFSGWAPLGGRGQGGIYIHSAWFEYFYDLDNQVQFKGRPVTLQYVLSHEVDHLLGENGHTDGAVGIYTTASVQCSEFGPD